MLNETFQRVIGLFGGRGRGRGHRGVHVQGRHQRIRGTHDVQQNQYSTVIDQHNNRNWRENGSYNNRSYKSIGNRDGQSGKFGFFNRLTSFKSN